MEEWRYSFTILDFGTGWKFMIIFTILTLDPGKIVPGIYWI
jgi:hypothetical protein